MKNVRTEEGYVAADRLGIGGTIPAVLSAPLVFPLLATVNGVEAVGNHIALSNGVSPASSPGDASTWPPVTGFGVLASTLDANAEIVVRTPFPLSAQATIDVSLASISPSPNDPSVSFVQVNITGTYGQVGSLDTVQVWIRNPDKDTEVFAGYVSSVLTA